jgi:hyperosmotically inducible periplasmic protein
MDQRRTGDDKIADDVKEQLGWDIRMDASRIEVEVHDGQVRLLGVVESEEVRRAAEADVWGISGVHEVENQLTIAESGRKRFPKNR